MKNNADKSGKEKGVKYIWNIILINNYYPDV